MQMLETMQMFEVSVVAKNHVEAHYLCPCWVYRTRKLLLQW